MVRVADARHSIRADPFQRMAVHYFRSSSETTRMANTISERELQFLLYEFLDTESLLQRERYTELSREVFDATLDAARELAEELLATHLRQGDEEEPAFIPGRAEGVGPTGA